MKRLIRRVCVGAASALLVVVPGMTHARAEEMAAAPPSIEQPLIREGDLAVQLTAALSMGTSQSEAEAENRLSEVGIMPKNGWMADYPVTPDILAELSAAVRAAADAKKIPLAPDAAVQRLNDTMAQAGLLVKAPSGGDTTIPQLPTTAEYPSTTEVTEYYYGAGPPVVTYYAPPPAYYYLYGWVPFPFWCNGFWFSGYFILHDFHTHGHHHGHHDNTFVSNHFWDGRSHGVHRVDPVARMSGRTVGLSNVMTRTGVTREIANPSGRTVAPHNGTVVHPVGPIMRRGGASSGYQPGYGYHARPVANRSVGEFQRSSTVMAPAVRSGTSSGASWSGSHSSSGSSYRSSGGGGGMHYSGGGFGGRGGR